MTRKDFEMRIPLTDADLDMQEGELAFCHLARSLSEMLIDSSHIPRMDLVTLWKKLDADSRGRLIIHIKVVKNVFQNFAREHKFQLRGMPEVGDAT